jgi:Rps23 Pro-64 3,4-dihydroxylase Tpa1-like proline 4-hydroxylase
VINLQKELIKIRKILKNHKFKKVNFKFLENYAGKFERYEKNIHENIKVSIDILIKEVLDRQTNAKFSYEWIFKNSKISYLPGKTIQEKIKLRIIDIDALFVMKAISCRSTDIRDIFMLAPKILSEKWIRSEINKRYDLGKRAKKIKSKVYSKQFKDGLQGVYGYIDKKVFDKHKKALLKIIG